MVLFNAGDHAPRIPLLEVVDKGDNGVPTQTGFTGVNVGVILELTTICNVVVVAH
jgi:hypothetical protein